MITIQCVLFTVTEEDVKRLIELRSSNEALFTGKRNAAKVAWKYVRVVICMKLYTPVYHNQDCNCFFNFSLCSAILKGLGLEGKLTADQIAKKWENLKTRYKVKCVCTWKKEVGCLLIL